MAGIAGCLGDEAQADNGEEAGEDNKTGEEKQDVKFATYTNDELGYEIEYPSDWIVDDSLPASVVIRLQESDHQILIDVFDYGEELSLDAIAEEAISNTELWMDNTTVLSETDLQLDSGEQGRVIEFEYMNPDDRVDRSIQSKLLLVPVENFVFQVEVATGQEAYTDAFDGLADTILSSLTIMGVPEPENMTPSVEDLTTYTNSQSGYSVDYPEAWTVWDQFPEEVYINDGTGTSELSIFVFDATGIESLDQLADEMIAILERDFSDVEVQDEQNRTLASGQDARFIDIMYDEPRDRLGQRRSHFVATIDSNSGYLVEMVALEEMFDEAFEELSEAILESFEVNTSSIQTKLSARSLSVTDEVTSALHHNFRLMQVGVSSLPQQSSGVLS